MFLLLIIVGIFRAFSVFISCFFFCYLYIKKIKGYALTHRFATHQIVIIVFFRYFQQKNVFIKVVLLLCIDTQRKTGEKKSSRTLNFFDFLIYIFFNFVWKTDKTSWKRKQKLRTWKMGFSRVLNFQSNNKNLFCVSKKKDI